MSIYDEPKIDCHCHVPLLKLVERFIPDAGDRPRVSWETPCRVLDFPC